MKLHIKAVISSSGSPNVRITSTCQPNKRKDSTEFNKRLHEGPATMPLSLLMACLKRECRRSMPHCHLAPLHRGERTGNRDPGIWSDEESQDFIRSGMVTSRATASCRLSPK